MEGGMGRETSFNLKWKTALSASAFSCIFACWREHDFCSGQQGLLYIILSFHSWSPLNPAALCGRFIRNSVSKVTWNGPAVGPCQAEKGESAVWPSIEYAFGLGLKLKFQIWWLIAGLGRTGTGWWASCGILCHPVASCGIHWHGAHCSLHVSKCIREKAQEVSASTLDGFMPGLLDHKSMQMT